jgi:hypothetical protein
MPGVRADAVARRSLACDMPRRHRHPIEEEHAREHGRSDRGAPGREPDVPPGPSRSRAPAVRPHGDPIGTRPAAETSRRPAGTPREPKARGRMGERDTTRHRGRSRTDRRS